MRTIPLTKGYVALVSDEDFERVNAYKWYTSVSPRTIYATRNLRLEDGKRRTVRMHRFITCVNDPQIEVDHRDHDGLNNQRENLRVCSPAQNMANRRKQQNTSSSQFKGVSWDKSKGKWVVKVQLNGKQRHLGTFTDEVEAAMAYDDAARSRGAFALTNFPEVVVEYAEAA